MTISFPIRVIQVAAPEAIAEQRANFDALLVELGNAPADQVDKILANRPVVAPEPDLSPETIGKLKKLIDSQRHDGG